MSTASFNPDNISPKNGCFLGLDHSAKEAEIVLVQAPWDVTTSYRPGAHHGPAAIIEASYQLDMYSHRVGEAWKHKIATLPPPPASKALNERLRSLAEKVIGKLEEGTDPDDKTLQEWLRVVNEEGKAFHRELYGQTKTWLSAGKAVLTVGGDHSVSQGPIQAHLERYPHMSILHIDAHADLREAYEGFSESHASIMNNVIRSTSLEKLVQIGIRDVSPTEVALIQSHRDRIRTFFDWDLQRRAYEGESWKSICESIARELSDQVYISFDIDGLDPRFCPDTGTPVPGGMELEQIAYLLDMVRAQGKKIIGGDLVEVAPGNPYNEWNANVGARALWMMCLNILASASS